MSARQAAPNLKTNTAGIAGCVRLEKDSGDFLPGLNALGAQIDPLFDPTHRHTNTLQIRIPAAPGVAHGVTDVVAELWPFAAHTACGHGYTPC